MGDLQQLAVTGQLKDLPKMATLLDIVRKDTFGEQK